MVSRRNDTIKMNNRFEDLTYRSVLVKFLVAPCRGLPVPLGAMQLLCTPACGLKVKVFKPRSSRSLFRMYRFA